MTLTDAGPISVLNTRTKRQAGLSYRLSDNSDRYGLDTSFPDGQADFDQSKMSMKLLFASGAKRDGVGDLLEVGGIKTDRHIKNPVCLFDHGKQPSAPVLPIGMSCVYDPAIGKYDKSQYTVVIDPIAKEAWSNTYFYQGKDLVGVSEDGTETDLFSTTPREKKFDHAVLCEQYYHMAVTGLLQGGSIGYQVIKAMELSPDYQTGTPQGLHLLVVLMLECSLVVMPANMDTVLKMLSTPRMCGKALSPVLVKSLSTYAPEQTTTVGFVKALNLKSIRQLYKVSPGPTANSSPRARSTPNELYYRFQVGDRVTARHGMMKQVKNPTERHVLFASPGDKLFIVSLEPDKMAARVRNANGDEQSVQLSAIRKHLEDTKSKSNDECPKGECCPSCKARLERDDDGNCNQCGKPWPVSQSTKSLDFKSIRHLYKTAKGIRRRLKKSSPGASVMYVAGKDIEAAQDMAEQKGLKFHRIGHVDGSEKIKLIGDDSSIDEVAKAFGTRVKSMNHQIKGWGDWLKAVMNIIAALTGNPITVGDLNDDEDEIKEMYNRGTPPQEAARKLKSLTKKKSLRGSKAMADDIDTGVTPEDNTATETDAVQEPEKHGVQVSRRVHEDHKILMKDYHEMMGPLEHEPTHQLLTKTLQGIESTLGEWEKHFGKHYKDSPPLADTDPGDAHAEDDSLEEETPDDTSEEDATEADSSEEKLPTPEEAAEGIKKDPEDGKKHLKNGKVKTVIGKKKGMCPKCNSADCKCGKSLGTGAEVSQVGNQWFAFSGDGTQKRGPYKTEAEAQRAAKHLKKDMTEKEASKIEGELGEVASDVAAETSDTEKSLQPHQMEMVNSAAQHCKELAGTQNFTDDHRLDSHHHAKNLDGIVGGGVEPNPAIADEQTGMKSDPAQPDQMPPTDLMQDDTKSMGWHKALGEASDFLHGVAREKAFGEPHRQEAGYHAEQLEGVASKAMPEEEIETKTDDVTEPGDIQEKALKNVFIAQQTQVNELSKVLERLCKV